MRSVVRLERRKVTEIPDVKAGDDRIGGGGVVDAVVHSLGIVFFAVCYFVLCTLSPSSYSFHLFSFS